MERFSRERTLLFRLSHNGNPDNTSSKILANAHISNT